MTCGTLLIYHSWYTLLCEENRIGCAIIAQAGKEKMVKEVPR